MIEDASVNGSANASLAINLAIHIDKNLMIQCGSAERTSRKIYRSFQNNVRNILSVKVRVAFANILFKATGGTTVDQFAASRGLSNNQ